MNYHWENIQNENIKIVIKLNICHTKFISTVFKHVAVKNVSKC